MVMLFCFGCGTDQNEQREKCREIVGNFDHHLEASVQCGVHCLVRHIPGFTRSHWRCTQSKTKGLTMAVGGCHTVLLFSVLRNPITKGTPTTQQAPRSLEARQEIQQRLADFQAPAPGLSILAWPWKSETRDSTWTTHGSLLRFLGRHDISLTTKLFAACPRRATAWLSIIKWDLLMVLTCQQSQ